MSLDFAGQFQNAPQGKKHMLVSVGNSSGWPEACFQLMQQWKVS